MKIRNSNIVIFALAKWNGPYSSTTFSLAKEFSKNNKVIYIERPKTWKDIITKHFKKKKWWEFRRISKNNKVKYLNENLIIYSPPSTLPSNFLSTGLLYNLIKKYNEKALFTAIKKLLENIDFGDYIYINIFNPFFNHRAYLRPILSIYYTVDNISQSTYVRKHGPRLEKEIMSQSDLTLTTSYDLKNDNLVNSKNTHYLPNAADLKIFDPDKNYEKPAEIKTIANEIITFIGHLDSRTNLHILKDILVSFPRRFLLIIGPVSIKKSDFLELENYNNLIFVGPKFIEEIPAFLKYSNCAIIPYKCNELTSSIYPLKINEYLAMGVPVVSTPFSEDIRQFEGIISLERTSLDFCNSIDFEIKNNSQFKIEERKKIARTNTWENRIVQFWQILERKSSLN